VLHKLREALRGLGSWADFASLVQILETRRHGSCNFAGSGFFGVAF